MAILATDLDGTLIPLDRAKAELEALSTLHRIFHPAPDIGIQNRNHRLAYVSGRSLKLVQQAIDQENLPEPDAVLGDVGTSLYLRTDSNAASLWQLDSGYQEELNKRLSGSGNDKVMNVLKNIEGIRLQPTECQTNWKLCYFSRPGELKEQANIIAARLKAHSLRRQIVSSQISEKREGFIDLLPEGVDKAFGVKWLRGVWNQPESSLIYAGDSGNDEAVFLSGINSIMVANTPGDIIQRVKSAAEAGGFSSALYTAEQNSTAGVLEGWRHFLNQL